MPVDAAEPRWCGEAAALLRLGVPTACMGLTPYDSQHFSRFLAVAAAVPEAGRTLFLRGEIEQDRLLAVADWRLLGSVLYLNGIAVLPSARGHGVAQELLVDGVRMARTLGCSALELDVIEDEKSARSLFRRFGFQPAGASTWLAPDVLGGPDHGVRWRIRNWPAFVPQVQAYGFGDLDVAGPEGAVSIRVLPGGWRISRLETAASLVHAIAPVIGHRPGRAFTVAMGSRVSSGHGEPFARFRRLRRAP